MTRNFSLLMLAALLWSSCGSAPRLQRFERSWPQMGTEFRVVLFCADARQAGAALDAAQARVAALNAKLSDYDADSELSSLSRQSQSAPMSAALPVSLDLWRVLEHGQQVADRSAGAFDMTLGPYVQLWRRSVRQEELPRPRHLMAAKAAVGWRAMLLEEETRSVRLTLPNMRLDLGGIAKGYALDEVMMVLRKHGITRALVDGGGDLLLGDAPPGRAGWRIAFDTSAAGESLAVAHSLQQAAEMEAFLDRDIAVLSNLAVATSGGSERFVEIDGQRYSHLIDPSTGLGLQEPCIVTIFAEGAMSADAWASAACVLGPDRALALIESLPQVEARAWTAQKGQGHPCETSGFSKRMRP